MQTPISRLLSAVTALFLSAILVVSSGCSKDDDPADMGLSVAGSYTGDLLSGLEIDPESPVSALVPLVFFEKLSTKSVKVQYARFSPAPGVMFDIEMDLTLSGKSGGKFAFSGAKSFTVNSVSYQVTAGGECGEGWVDLSLDVSWGDELRKFAFQGDRLSELLLDFSAAVAGTYTGSWYAQQNFIPVVPDPSGPITLQKIDESHIRIRTTSVLFAEFFPVSLDLETALFKRLGGYVVDSDSAYITVPAELSPTETPFEAKAIYSCSINGDLIFFDISIEDIDLLVSFSGTKL